MEEPVKTLQKEIKNLTKLVKAQTQLLEDIAKALHLLPVTEDEERNIQIAQRKNLEQAAKVNDDLNKLENKLDSPNGIGNLFSNIGEIYSEVLGDDVLGGITNE